MTDKIEVALKKAYMLGQTYWQQADSESYAQNRKSDETQARFDALVSETVDLLRAAAQHEPSERVDELDLRFILQIYDDAMQKAFDGRKFDNPCKPGTLAAKAWEIGTKEGTDKRDKGLPNSIAKEAVTPIDMVLHCPKCGVQHIDAREEDEIDDAIRSAHAWDNPPHRSHLCHGCGHIWRPADVPTNGVAAIKTAGKNDSPPYTPAAHTDNEGEPLPSKSLCCRACSTVWERVTTFIVCKTCGNKRCPHAEDHRYACTGSNEPDQVPRFADGQGDGEVLALADTDFREQITPAELAKLMRDNPDLRFTVDNKPDDLEAMRRDAERYRWLRHRVLAADFDYDGTGESALVFSWPTNVRIGADCDKNIDAAIAAEKREG